MQSHYLITKIIELEIVRSKFKNMVNNENDKKKDKLFSFKSICRLSLFIFIGLSIYLLVSTIILLFLAKPNKEAVVPHVVGKEFIGVYDSLTRKGLRPEIKFLDVYDLDNGIVLNQHPESGSIVPDGSKINLVISRSSNKIMVPNLIGLKLPFAVNKLKNLHGGDRSYSLGIGAISYIPSDKIKESMIIDHSPSADEEVSPERKINILVSAGKIEQEMRMPRLKGQSIDLCYNLLLAKGLTVIEKIVITDKKWRSGTIQSHKPDRGEEIWRGKVVRLKVNYYPIKEHPYTSYERVRYTIPSDEESGLYEVHIEDSKPRRIRYYRRRKPEDKIDFIFNRKGNAKVSISRNKKIIEVIGIDVDEFDL